MVSKEGGKCMLTNSESDSEAVPLSSTSLALEVKYSLDAGRQVRKRNKALQVRFKDICEAQNEQREAELQAAGRDGKPLLYKVAYRKYMTVPARRSIPNVTRSTGVQTSPDLKKRYQTFPLERKKGHTFKHVAAVETYKGQNNGFVMEVKPSRAAEQCFDDDEEEGAYGGSGVRRTKALLHTNECIATVEQHTAPDGLCSDALLLSCSAGSDCLVDVPKRKGSGVGSQGQYQLCSVPSKVGAGLRHREADTDRSAKRLVNLEEGSSRTLPDRASKVTGPIAWNSLTQVECLDSLSVRNKRKKSLQLNGLQSETLPRSSRGCTTQAQYPVEQLSARPLGGMDKSRSLFGGDEARGAPSDPTQEACKQIVPMNQDGDVKAQLQAMENLISSSQETIKVLLGVIQELEKGEAHREGVELDFKQQEDKLQPLMKMLCPTDDTHFAALPYPQEAFTSTPKRKSKAESKKHARWRFWFM
ncbi:inhibitory synaptic factor 2A isoform X2 [Dunckerocampus dactyliophorus]|uniref:inhibitory synaptic factor 2A isoform X2 n=1 Tax=Dunckerocampus dactyliophorus TaxID=161453 RepID=UPI002405ECEF|nr:inhibitory synaptic factor 2A isoform X2 [Dunckerocampus dactyliophorus]